ncbi:hypothetical protein HNQ51_001731 [Inhella inkyongensis]|uniref:Uncharacterized protein n=1 Tax=Inhella inkyongensis TaxID=392593 RepID=A0A840S035_9BURK|nr:hypothetical protein [Inhella inkyongensis]MBB5204417.1 hypothetical protein [Inhella inkyongensis]
MKPRKHFFAPGVVQHCPRPRRWLQGLQRAWPAVVAATALVAALALVACSATLAQWLSSWSTP